MAWLAFVGMGILHAKLGPAAGPEREMAHYYEELFQIIVHAGCFVNPQREAQINPHTYSVGVGIKNPPRRGAARG